MNSTPDTHDTPAPPSPDPAPRRLERSGSDRIIAGVCGGLGRYFGIDATLVRIAFVALALLGGTGLIVYAAALLLVPLDDTAPAAPASGRERTIAVGITAVVVTAAVLLGSFGLFLGGALVPLSLLALAGLAVYWLVSGERPAGSPGAVVRRAAQGVGLLAGCAVIACASFFASGLGGGVVVAGLVIAAGAALVVAAFVGGARWLVLPALAIALPLAFVSAAGIDLDGGFGERRERPGTLAELQSGYRLGAGELIVDLRDLDLPPGDHGLSVGIGAGHALVLVPDDVCIASSASIGMGAVAIFDRESGGINVDWHDGRRAPAKTARLVVDGDVGLGFLEVRHQDVQHGPGWDKNSAGERNDACLTRTVRASAG